MVKKHYNQSSKAKYIAMIDLFAFLLILLFFVILNNPKKEDLEEIRNIQLALQSENALLEKELHDAKIENIELMKKNESLRVNLEILETEIQSKKELREFLMQRFKKEFAALSPELMTQIQKNHIELEEAFDILLNASGEMVAILDPEDKKTFMEDVVSGEGGNFKLAQVNFSAGDFLLNPVDALRDPESAQKSVDLIIRQYLNLKDDFPYIFIIGHANSVDAKDTLDSSISARRIRNWIFAMRRAITIAGLFEQQATGSALGASLMNHIIIASTGEFDQRFPDNPYSDENAWVEVVFCKEWKPPSWSDKMALEIEYVSSLYNRAEK